MSRIGRYELLEPLGSGPNGAVWLAASTDMPGRRLVLKHPRPGLPEPERAQRAAALALRELRDASLPKEVVPVLDVTPCDEDGRFGVVSPWVPGKSLAEVLRGIDLSVPGRLESLLAVLDRFVEVLAGLHGRGFAHGAVHPGNLLLGEAELRGQVRLLDLAWTRAGLGCPKAPELIAGGPARPATDQWGLAVLLSEHLPASRPVPAELRRALDRARSPQVAERYPRIEQLGRCLDEARLELGGGDNPGVGSETPTARPGGLLGLEDALDAASLAPTVQTEAPVRPALAIDLSKEAGPPSMPLPIAPVGPNDPTATLPAAAAARSSSAPWVAVAVGLTTLLGLSWASCPSASSPPANPDVAPRRQPPEAHEPAKPPSSPIPEPSSAAEPSLPPCSAQSWAGCRSRAGDALSAGRGAEARRLLERACDGGDGRACAELAGLWRDGIGGEIRAGAARGFTRRACALGHRSSCSPRSGLDRSKSGP